MEEAFGVWALGSGISRWIKVYNNPGGFLMMGVWKRIWNIVIAVWTVRISAIIS